MTNEMKTVFCVLNMVALVAAASAVNAAAVFPFRSVILDVMYAHADNFLRKHHIVLQVEGSRYLMLPYRCVLGIIVA